MVADISPKIYVPSHGYFSKYNEIYIEGANILRVFHDRFLYFVHNMYVHKCYSYLYKDSG